MFVAKDSVSDPTNSHAQHKPIEPRLQADGKEDLASTDTESSRRLEHFQSKGNRKKLDGSYECTPRARRSTSRPSHRRNSDKHPGPAIPPQAHRRIIDSRDSAPAKKKRLNLSQDPFRSYRRHTTMNRSKTRPKHPNPGSAIAKTKQEIPSLHQGRFLE